MEPYAIPQDLQFRWPSRTLTDAEIAAAAILLPRASRMVRREFGTDARIAAGTLDVEDVVDVVCDMVKRALIGDDYPGVSESDETKGPFGQRVKYANPMGDLYFTKNDRATLGLPESEAFSIGLC